MKYVVSLVDMFGQSHNSPWYKIHYNTFLQDTVTGFILAGIGHRTAKNSNFLIVNQDTKIQQVEEAFKSMTTRDDIGIILINQHVANDIRHVLKDYNETIPTVLEIPSKEHPYDPEQDYIMVRLLPMRMTHPAASNNVQIVFNSNESICSWGLRCS